MKVKESRKRLLVLWVLVSVFVLLACGLFAGGADDSPAAGVDADDSAAAESLPKDDSSSDGEQPEPESLEDDQVESEGDGQSMDDDSSESDAIQQVSGPGWGESNTPAQTACDNPYMPIREGSTWTFEDTEGPNAVWTITEVIGDLNQASATMLVVTDGITLTYHWECQTGGSMASFDYAGLESDTANIEMVMELQEGSGEFLAAADSLELGFTWDFTMQSVFSYTMSAEGETFEAFGSMAITETHEVVSVDPVIFNGETVNGIEVVGENERSMMVVMMGVNQPQYTKETDRMIFAYGIGLLKDITDSDFGKVELILSSYYIP